MIEILQGSRLKEARTMKWKTLQRDADEAGNDNDADGDAEADQDAESPMNTSHASEGPGIASQANPDMPVTSPDSTNIISDLTSVFHPSSSSGMSDSIHYDIVPTTPHLTAVHP
ncbi:Transcription factor spt8 [Aspergillus fumigatus]